MCRALVHVLLLLAVLACGTEGTECTEQKVNECLAPLADYEADVNEAVVIFLSEEDLIEHCELYEKFNLCMRDVRPYCGDLDLLVFEGIDDAYHFLCDEAFDEYLSYRECFNNSKLHEEGEYCNMTLNTKLDKLDTNAGANYNRDRICQYAGDYLDCVENAVESFCGSSAGKWQRELDERSLRPLLARLHCPNINYNENFWNDWEEYDTGTGTVQVVVAISLTVVTLIILILVVMMVMMYRKRKRQQQAVQEQLADRVPQVHYGNGSGVGGGSVSVLPPGWTPGAGAGPLPEKGMMPPPYTTAENATHPVSPGAVIPPPAYSDITVVRKGRAAGNRSEHGGALSTVGGASTVSGATGYDNVAMSTRDEYDTFDNAVSIRAPTEYDNAPSRRASGSVHPARY